MSAGQGSALLQIESLSIPIPGGGDRAFAVQGIDLTLHAGEILCVVGESGSGKSMSANAVMGLLPSYMQPSAGRILFQGRDLLTLPEDELRKLRGSAIGMIFQEPLSALNPVMRVGQQIAEVLQVHGVSDAVQVERRVAELMAFVGLPDPERMRAAYPFRLSGGQRQRVMIAMALALEPAILIADEPTTALDVTTQARILALIQSIQRSRRAGSDGQATAMGVMFITHDFGVVAEIADRVAVMEKGVLVEVGHAEQVLNAPRHPYTQRLIAAVPRRRTGLRDAVAESPPVLDVRKLSKTYASGGGWFGARRVVRAVDDVSFTVRRGETLGIVGESGSGKSTIGKCLLKLVDVDGGQMLFNGRDIAAMSAHAFRPLRKGIQMVFQDPFASLNPRQTVGRIVSDGPVASGKTRAEAEARARELLALVGLEASSFDRYPNEFSGGQRQRVGIARALALDPQVLVADESVSALDVSVQAQVLALLHQLQQRLQIALVFITHDLRVAAQVCDTVLVMHQGRIVERGSPQQIFDRPQDAYTQRLIAAVPGQQWNPTQAHAT
ncbi:dipeptide ABC transporter ATP-binding protein [Pseudorhodoferax soli]|uniref:Peptide/nickel transport system ATP-binding protein n=1 Tax=Pseudorhodoferax soli TaxID=545864 RepID=A0A368YBI2_9BURK|nr:ABC transporter ATP-binding protein [Pseudorhodoferax soli]RCW75554.1 peptide/nickel transport system ATP-binding protein [Pseudorhodoferax soli]